MAVIRDNVIVSPSAGAMSEAELNSITIEPGNYLLTTSKTIGSVTSDKWAIQCISDADASNPKCYVQLWMPVKYNLPTAEHTIFMRTLDSTGAAWGNYENITAAGGGGGGTIITPDGIETIFMIQAVEPTPIAGKNIIWIDTSTYNIVNSAASTILDVKVNGTSVVSSHTANIVGVEETANKVTSISSASTNTQYPSALAVYTYVETKVGSINTSLASLTTPSSNS